MIKCGLLGKKLGHSYSPQIHKMLGQYEYVLYEKEEDEIGCFIKEGDWTGINVTIPYKKTVLPYLDDVSDTVKLTGSVNTIIRDENGKLFGDNTDVFGFDRLVRRSGIDVKGKKTLVLGSGGASASVCAALGALGAIPVVISRSGKFNYENMYLNRDARVIVNTTPLGMYPNNGEAAVSPGDFPDLEGVIDVIYNPARTKLLLLAEKAGIPCANGLYMLVSQARRSAELFTSSQISPSVSDAITEKLARDEMNIVLIGMPGCGKSTAARLLGNMTRREVIDSDDEIKKRTGLSPEEIITSSGEAAFRDIESKVLADIGKLSGKIIATGGGAVTVKENRDLLRQNGFTVWIKRDVSELEISGRPLSKKGDLYAMYEKRKPLYASFADACVESQAIPEATAEKILLEFDGGDLKI